MKGIKAILYALCVVVLVLALWFFISDLTGKHPGVVYALEETAAEPSPQPALTGLVRCADNMETFFHDAQIRAFRSPAEDVLVGACAISCSYRDRQVFAKSASKGEVLTFLGLQEVRDNQMSYSDYYTLLQIVEAEATGGDEKSKQLIADVVLNRIRDDRFPDTVTEVVYQYTDGCAQFSPTADGRIYKVSITNSTISAVNKAIEEEDISDGALFFVARQSAKKENVAWFDDNLIRLFDYGGHEFYTFPEQAD